jgi:phosphate transport system protein
VATRIKFQQNLDDLKERLLIMAGMAEQAIQRSIEAYRTRDLSICEMVFQSEPVINRLEREIDQMALDLLAMEQPMAIDLRFILSVIRINADLERVGDQAVNIAVRVREMGAFANIDLPVDIPKLASLASAMVRKALQAFIEADAELAQSVLKLDDQVDEMNDAAFYALSTLIKEKAGADAAEPERADCRAEPGAGGRPCDQYCRGCDLLGARQGCAAWQRGGGLGSVAELLEC